MINLNGYTPTEHLCKCGKTHSFYTRIIETGDGATDRLPSVCKSIMAEGRIGLVCDENVKHIAEDAESLLVRAGYRTRLFCLPPDSECTRDTADKMVNSSEDIRLWIAVGTGNIADIVRYSATCRANEWISVMTAPTTDSILYPYCEFFENSERFLVRAVPPIALIADYSVIENAPKYTVAAGYGTLLSKLLRAFDFGFDEITDRGRCKYLTSEFNDNLQNFFNTQSCEALSLRICRTLIRLGLVAQLADEEDFCQGGEYFAARCLRMQCDNKRLLGENAAIAVFCAYCILNGYLTVCPDDLFIPSSAPEFFRYLDKTCGFRSVSLLKNAKHNSQSEAHLYVVKEYSDDLLRKLKELFPNINAAAKQFRRLYDDAGYWLCSYCSVENALKTVAAAYAAHSDGLLSSIVLGGALDNAC